MLSNSCHFVMKMNSKEWYRGGHRSRGFTLVELLVVIAIIGILATLVLLQLGTARGRARDTQRISHVNQLRTAVEQYFEDNLGTYPDALTDANLGDYIARVPMDPLDSEPYGYVVDAATDSYMIYACLEQNAAALNSDLDNDGTTIGGPNLSVATTEECTDHDGTFGTCDCIYDTGIIN